jgi:hypothetical protein
MTLIAFHRTWRTRRGLLAAAALLALVALVCAPRAFALSGEEHAHWSLESRVAPENLPLGGEGIIIVTASNLGDGEVHGESSPVQLTDVLPQGVEAIGVERSLNSLEEVSLKEEREPRFVCAPIKANAPVECKYTGKLPPYELLQLKIRVKVSAAASAESKNTFTVSGGGAQSQPVRIERPVRLNDSPASFGVESFEMAAESENFETDEQSGSHPFQLTTTFNLNQGLEPDQTDANKEFPSAPALEKSLTFKLPPGLIGNVNAVDQCTGADFGSQGQDIANACPNDTVVGVASVTVYDPNAHSEFYATYVVPVFNLEPGPGEPARFGFSILHVPVTLDTSIRTGSDYGVNVSVNYSSQSVQVVGSKVTFWGIPGDERHNASRGWRCLFHGVEGVQEACGTTPGATRPVEPLLMLPTKCLSEKGEPEQLETNVSGSAWKNDEQTNTEPLRAPGEASGGSLNEVGHSIASENAKPLIGCGGLEFNPTVSVEPEEHAASTPTGLTVTVKLPQAGTMEPVYENKPEAAVSSTRLALPEGLQASAGASNGLTACSVESAGFIGTLSESGVPLHTSAELSSEQGASLGSELASQGFTPAQAACLESSKIGSVNIKTPVLNRELTGGVYLAEQDTNPFASPLALYIIAEDKAPGEETSSKVLVKLAGEVSINPATGQLTSDFKNTPQSPVQALTLHLWNGARASQATPARCGGYTSAATFTNSSDATPVGASSEFQITSGPGGAPCPEAAALPFTPSFEAESTNTQAAAFTPFKLRVRRPDGDAALKTISMQLPPGLAAVLASVPLCPEPQAAAGDCSAESEIGQSVARSGLGGTPFSLSGKVYLTGPYNGAPFGLSSVTEATNVGPFQVGKIVVRSGISVNAFTAAATISTEAAQFYPVVSDVGGQEQFAASAEQTFEGLPEILKGVPAQIKELEVTVDREHFEFNPTNCEKMAIDGKLTGYEGTSSEKPASFEVGNCASLPFEPKITASVAAQGSKLEGTKFAVTVESPGLGQAGIHKVDLTLPEALPSRLETIQKACLEVVFNANPASCDEGSLIGEGIIHTPVLKSPLRGPAYLVSHGNAAFPDVEFVLQGENGLELILDGKTDIKKGITYSRFESNPDAPFTKFESIFPAGRHSALTDDTLLAPTYNLCKLNLAIPTEITGQNGAFKSLSTKVAIEGCGGVLPAKAKKLTRAQLLTKALKACKSKDKKNKAKRLACEKVARKKYGPKAKKPAKKAAKKSSRR